jgi:hypothetical protein
MEIVIKLRRNRSLAALVVALEVLSIAVVLLTRSEDNAPSQAIKA